MNLIDQFSILHQP
uniref:Uncharacterized protein n=1 Tax=Megaselia scalaris TaxID=36166 RepID=T1H157_MEGSC